jgi:molybdate transport system substrate-binding protein
MTQGSTVWGARAAALLRTAKGFGLAVGLIALGTSVDGCMRKNPVGGAPSATSGSAASSTASSATSATRRPATENELVVFAASSLRDAFGKLARDFEASHPGTHVALNFAGTSQLRAQVEQGAPADVFASADEEHMTALLKASRAAGPVSFTRNEPVLVVAKDSAKAIKSLADLPKASRLVFGSPDVPIGRYSLQILDRAAATLGADFRLRVEAKVVSHELNVRQVLAKVSLGEAQAGFVYRSDVQGKLDGITVVTLPKEYNVIAAYPIAVLTDAPHPKLARDWITLVMSAAGQRVFREAGFLPVGEDSPAP